jgi:hypothetical protein
VPAAWTGAYGLAAKLQVSRPMRWWAAGPSQGGSAGGNPVAATRSPSARVVWPAAGGDQAVELLAHRLGARTGVPSERLRQGPQPLLVVAEDLQQPLGGRRRGGVVQGHQEGQQLDGLQVEIEPGRPALLQPAHALGDGGAQLVVELGGEQGSCTSSSRKLSASPSPRKSKLMSTPA